MSFEAIFEWYGLNNENGAVLLSPVIKESSGSFLSLVIGTVLSPGKRVCKSDASGW